MAVQLACADIGISCDHVITGRDEQDLVERATLHLQNDHGMRELDEQLAEKMRRAVREGD
ncbi:MAG TPA: DUF1059 domain-containing protein [Actinomycetota bacterium]|nr:DUF1059 domain-containing protein [Actinomycetota bacterium]